MKENFTKAILEQEELFSKCPDQIQSAIKLYASSFYYYNLGDFKRGRMMEEQAFEALRDSGSEDVAQSSRQCMSPMESRNAGDLSSQSDFEEPEIRKDYYVPRKWQEME